MDIRGGGGGGARSGCIMWTDGLVDLRLVDGGQDLYLKSARSELGMPTAIQQNLLCSSISAAVALAIGILSLFFP